MEFVLRVFGGCCLTHCNELLVELGVHYGENQEVNQSDYEQQRGEKKRCYDGVCAIDSKGVANHRREEHSGKDTDTGNRHLEPHGERHLLAFEPLSENLAHRSTCHLATAAEYHKTEHG